MSLQLICINYGEFDDAFKAVHHSLKVFPIIKRAVILHPFPMASIFMNKNRSKVPIEIFIAESKTQNECFTFELPKYITCDHVIGIQWDGFIVRPDLWNDEWLKYDWIAPPWPLQNIPNPQWRVGSGGFIMFSKRMSELWPEICDGNSYNDWQIGATKRDQFEAEGMKYAPLEVAMKFGEEIPLDDQPKTDSFGFHGFQYGDHEKYRSMAY
jgi:hypothetical protein